MPDAGTDPTSEWNELMLAMDVVDTLRYQHVLVDRELKSDQDDRLLIDKVRDIYVSQGIEVSEDIIARGVLALREERFAFRPPKDGFRLKLARLYVNRGRWAKIGAVLLALLACAYPAYHFLVAVPNQKAREQVDRMPAQLARQRDAVMAEGKEGAVSVQAETLYRDGMAALQRQDVQVARDMLTSLEQMHRQVVGEYTLRIVSRPGEPSGVWRTPDDNPDARNYYLLVEAVTPAGDRLKLPVTSEEDGQTRVVSQWGVRVSPAVFDRIKTDKQMDGIVNENILAEKKRGFLQPHFRIQTAGGAITRW